jgi:hypothetical protein
MALESNEAGKIDYLYSTIELKYSRISMLEPEITNGYLLFSETLNPCLIEQMTLLLTGYDDAQIL